jgi:hypothetical protein
MSIVSRIFPEQQIGGMHRRWPMASNNTIINVGLSVAVVFKSDSGYLRIYTEEGNGKVIIKAYPTKTMLKRIPPDVLFTLDITPSEFAQTGLDSEMVTTESIEMDDIKMNKIGHMMRIFSDSISNPGNNYARRTSIMD